MNLSDVMSLSELRFDSYGYHFVEHNLKLKCTHAEAIQLLAFEGIAQDAEGNTLHIKNWRDVSPYIIGQIRSIMFTTYRGVVNGKNIPNEEGVLELISVGTEVVVEDGGISLPDYNEAKKHGENFGETQLL